jgi:hypothetical protein
MYGVPKGVCFGLPYKLFGNLNYEVVYDLDLKNSKEIIIIEGIQDL